MSYFEVVAAAYQRLEGVVAAWMAREGPPPDAALAALLAPSALARRVRATVPAGRLWRSLVLSRVDPRCEQELAWGCALIPFGEAVLAFDAGALWHLSFTGLGRAAEVLLRRHLPAARFLSQPDPVAAARWAGRAFDTTDAVPLHLRLSGTAFQFRVWQALARIPAGGLCDYGTLAHLAGAPGAARAAGTAMARNPVAWLIPCHRVIRGDGRLGHYQSGAARKGLMLAWEAGVLALPGWSAEAMLRNGVG